MEKQYIRSERAHFMCPNMHFGIMIHIADKLDIDKLKECFEIMSKAHPFLRSTISYEKNSTDMYYDIKYKSMVEINIRKSINTMWQDYKDISVTEWNVLKNGLLKVFVYQLENEVKILFVAHHLLGDGRCILELVNEFANLYVEGIEPAYSKEELIYSIEDLPEKSELTGVSKYLINRLNKQWKKENKKVGYQEYAKFSDEFAKNNPVLHEVMTIETKDCIDINNYCKENDITINDLLMAKMYIGMNTQKIIIAADVRNKLKNYNKGAYGNYASAMGIVIKNKSKNVLEKALQIHKEVKKYVNNNSKLMMVLSCYLNMDQDLIDAVAIASLGNFKSKAAKFVGDNMFGFKKRDGISMTNLGGITNKNILEAVFIPPASPAVTQIIGILTVNNKMSFCCSYYEKVISSEEVKEQMNQLK